VNTTNQQPKERLKMNSVVMTFKTAITKFAAERDLATLQRDKLAADIERYDAAIASHYEGIGRVVCEDAETFLR
jgi:hypothetical protein